MQAVYIFVKPLAKYSPILHRSLVSLHEKNRPNGIGER